MVPVTVRASADASPREALKKRLTAKSDSSENIIDRSVVEGEVIRLRASTPVAISDAQKGRLFHARNVIGDAQRLAKSRLDDPAFPWRKFGWLVGNFLMVMPSGRYVFPGAKRPMSWPAMTPAVALCYFSNRLFETVDLAPEWLVAEVAAGIADAHHRDEHVAYVASDCGRKLRAKAAEILALELWRLAPIDCTEEEWQIMKNKRLKQKRTQKRRANGARPQAEVEANSIAAEARRLGIKPDTLQKRLRRSQAKDVRSGVKRKSISNANDNGPDTHLAQGARPEARRADYRQCSPNLIAALSVAAQALRPTGMGTGAGGWR